MKDVTSVVLLVAERVVRLVALKVVAWVERWVFAKVGM